MFWLYFARDFYRSARPAQSSLSAECAAIEEVETLPIRAKQAPLTSASPVVRSRKKIFAPVYSVSAGAITETDLSPSTPLSVAESLADASLFQAAACLQRLSTDGAEAYAVWEEDLGFTSFSANFGKITGLDEEETYGHDWIHGLYPEYQFAIHEALINGLLGHDTQCLVRVRAEHRIQTHDSDGWLRLEVKGVRALQPSVMVFWRDVTTEKALEETLGKLETSLSLSERGRTSFLTNMSHELRTPLNAIMGFSQMMQSGVMGPMENNAYADYVQHIHQSGTVLLNKINDLISIAQLDTGEATMKPVTLKVLSLIQEAVAMQSHQAFVRGQSVQVDCAEAIEIKADRAHMLSALSHLLVNALRHSATDGVVAITARVDEQEGLTIGVRDYGEGITHARLSAIRNALAEPSAYVNIQCEGIGVGLALTKELIERHGGSIMVDSMRHKGTIVTLQLPASCITKGLSERRTAYLRMVEA